MKVGIIGGGAAGFFAAISVKEHYPKAKVFIFEKSQKVLSKVKVSGGGRCNVTNACFSISELAKAYPRGGKKLKKVFKIFNPKNTMDWFTKRGVALKIENNNCVFPVSNSSETIINCLLKQTQKLGILVELGKGVKSIELKENYFKIHFIQEKNPPKSFDKIIVATGGSPKKSGLNWLEALNHEIEKPVPSLFTFNMPKENIKNLMGVSVKKAIVNVQGTKLKSEGPLLITHWGMSGPAVLKLSAFGARILNELNYDFKIQVNWSTEKNYDLVQEYLKKIIEKNPQKLLQNIKPFDLPERLWLFLLDKIAISEKKKWNELGKKNLNKLTNLLCNDIYKVNGKTTFKEEFVTCGGISLKNIDFNSMQSKVCKNLYFAGEVLDIDGITGGYNFQAAWTTGFIAGKLLN